MNNEVYRLRSKTLGWVIGTYSSVEEARQMKRTLPEDRQALFLIVNSEGEVIE